MNNISVLGIFVADISFLGPKIPAVGETILAANITLDWWERMQSSSSNCKVGSKSKFYQ